MNKEKDYLDKTKYFLIPEEDMPFFENDQDRVYAIKGGSGHKGLAYSILSRTGLSYIYYRYEERIPAAVFLTYCGYILVDEGEIKYKAGGGLFDRDESINFTLVGYCSAVLSQEEIDNLKEAYKGENNEFSDSYERNSGKDKDRIDEIIERVKQLRTERPIPQHREENNVHDK